MAVTKTNSLIINNNTGYFDIKYNYLSHKSFQFNIKQYWVGCPIPLPETVENLNSWD